ncbi:MAG: hypothetical protein WKF29_01515 [Thermoleophilaceae bacterium]
MSASLDPLVDELEQAAARLRAGDLDPPDAAELVERCAELAAHIGSELDRAGREAERDAPAEGQEQLL